MSRIPNKKTEVQQISIDSEDESRRIDNFLMSRFKGLPRTRVYQMLRRGEVRVNKGRKKPGYRLQSGDILRIPPISLETERTSARPPRYLLNMLESAVLFEDEKILVVNKPSGIVVHAGSGRSFGVIEVLRHMRPEDSNLQLVHRIDQATSGCLLLSKTGQGLRELHQALKSGKMEKGYIALLGGDIGPKPLTVDLALRKNTLSSGERIVRPDKEGKRAVSTFSRSRLFRQTCLADIFIETGRTHQIRVHAQSIGHPVAGDEKYGDESLNRQLRKAGLSRLFLHASTLTLPSYGNKGLNLKAPLSEELADFISRHD